MDILAENPLARMLRLRTICSGFLKDDDGEMHELKCEKLEVLKEFLDGWERNSLYSAISLNP